MDRKENEILRNRMDISGREEGTSRRRERSRSGRDIYYRESQKTCDLEDDLVTFKRHFRKNERSFNKSKYGKKLL